jgi:hypothetical protein
VRRNVADCWCAWLQGCGAAVTASGSLRMVFGRVCIGCSGQISPNRCRLPLSSRVLLPPMWSVIRQADWPSAKVELETAHVYSGNTGVILICSSNHPDH